MPIGIEPNKRKSQIKQQPLRREEKLGARTRIRKGCSSAKGKEKISKGRGED